MRPELTGPRSIDGLRQLCDYVNQPSWHLVEIGSYQGESTELFCQRFAGVISFDPYRHPKGPKIRAAFQARMKPYLNWVQFIEKSIDGARRFLEQSVDIVYIDGLHNYNAVREDILTWRPKIRPGGIICGHDYGTVRHPGVKRAVLQLLGVPEQVFSDTSWLVKL